MSGVAAADNEGIIGGFPLRWLRLRDGIDGAALLTSFSSYKPGAEGGRLYSCDGGTWLRMVLNSGSSAARASINAGELSWQGVELGVEMP